MSSDKEQQAQPQEQDSGKEPELSTTEENKSPENVAPQQTDAAGEVKISELTNRISPVRDSRPVTGDEHEQQLTDVESTKRQSPKTSDEKAELETSFEPSQSVDSSTVESCKTEASSSTTGEQENVSDRSRSYSTLEEDSRDGFGMQIVETSPGEGRSKKKGGRKRKKGEKSLKPRKLRLILPNKPEGAEGECSNAEFLDPSFESHLEDIGRNYSLSTTNVKNILHRVITNEGVVAMMRHTVREDQGEEESEGDGATNNPLAELFEPKMTRARAKEVAEKGSFVVPWPISPVKKPAESQPAKFIDLSFEEDEDDDEYEPEDDENEESDIDSIASRDTSDFGSPMPSTPRQFLHTFSESDRRDDSEDMEEKPESGEQEGKMEPHIRIQPIPMGPPLPPVSKEKTDAAFLSELDTFDEELSELSGRTARSAMDFTAEENLGLIANRTRSKCPLKDTPIDIIEAAFNAPDITQDMYDTECDDSEWQSWLKGLFKTDLDISTDADDEQNDPDYNFLQEEEEVDTEDLRDDRAVRITKKEVNELMDELLQQYEEEMEQLGGDPAPGLEDSCTMDPLGPAPTRTFVKPPPISFDGPLSTVMAKTHKTVQAQLQEEQRRRKDPLGGRRVQPLPVLSHEERQQLSQQMQQHVQLLCQVHVLTREEPQLQEVAQVTKNFLNETQMFVQRSTQLYQMQLEQYRAAGAQLQHTEFRSMFDTCNLQGAIDIVNQSIPVRSSTASPMKKVAKSKGQKLIKLPACSQATIAASKVFMYPALLPTCGPDVCDHKQGKEKPHFHQAEDNLLVLGLHQYQGMSNVEILHFIRENMIPTKTTDQIRIRIKNLKANKKKTGNVVQVYNKTKQLPALPVVCPDMEADQAVPPVQLQVKHLPEWLQEYQQTGKQKTEAVQTKKMRNLSPRKAEKLSPTQRGILPKGFVPVVSVKKALFQSPSKLPNTAYTANSDMASPVASTSTARIENTARNTQAPIAPKADVIPTSSVESSTPMYIMLPTNVVPSCLSQTSPPLSELQSSVQAIGGAATGMFVVVSPPTSASVVQVSDTHLSTADQDLDNASHQSVVSSTASTASPKEVGTSGREKSSTPVTVSDSGVESICVASPTNPSSEQPQPSCQSEEKEEVKSRENEAHLEDSIVSDVQILGKSSPQTGTSDVNQPSLLSSEETCTTEDIITHKQTDTDVLVLPGSLDNGNPDTQPQHPVQAANLQEATCPDGNMGGTVPDVGRGTEDCEFVSEEMGMVEASSSPMETQENQIMQDMIAEQSAQTESEMCIEQPCAEQAIETQVVDELTSQTSEEVHCGQAVVEENPVVGEDLLASSTEEQDLLSKEAEVDNVADVETHMSEEQSSTSKRMVMVKKKAKRRRKQLQKDMASTLLLLDSDLMDRDPLREERETLMAKAFLERVRDAVREEDGKYLEVLQVFHQGGQEGKTIVQLYQELQRILSGRPALLGEFAAFLQPAEAVACDLFMEHQEYVQARTFLRKLEVFFSDNPEHYHKVLRVFASYMREGASLDGLRHEITPLLQGQPYLLQEFTRFFPDLPPPQSMMGDFEEIHMASDSDGDEVPDNFEEIVLPDEDDDEVTREKKQVDPWKLLLAQKHGTKECKCECHESSTDLRVQRRNRHCVACNTKLTPKDLQAKKDILLRHQALIQTRESPIPDRTRRKIPARRRRKKADSETARDNLSLDTAMIEESCSSPPNQGYDGAGTENISPQHEATTTAGHNRRATTRSQKSLHQTLELAKFSPLVSGHAAGSRDGLRKSLANEEDAEESSQESEEEMEQVTEEAVRNLRDLCEEIPAPDWQKSATIVESFRRRLQEIAQHGYGEEEEEDEEEDDDEDKLSSGDDSQDAEYSDLEEASGSGSASPSSLQGLSAATSPGAASQGSEESPKASSIAGHSRTENLETSGSLQGVATSPRVASQASEESPNASATAGQSRTEGLEMSELTSTSLQGLSAVTSPGAASQGSKESPEASLTTVQSRTEGLETAEVTVTSRHLLGQPVTTSPGLTLPGSEDSTMVVRTTVQCQQGLSAATLLGTVSHGSEESPSASIVTGQSTTAVQEATLSQDSDESSKTHTTMGRSRAAEIEAAEGNVAGAGKDTSVGRRQEAEASQQSIVADQLGQDFEHDAVEVEDVNTGSKEGCVEDSRTFKGPEESKQDKLTAESSRNITSDEQDTNSLKAAGKRVDGEHVETGHDLGVDTSGEGHVDVDSLTHAGGVSTRCEQEERMGAEEVADENMAMSEGTDSHQEAMPADTAVESSSGEGTVLWTRDQDRTLLEACQQQGATPQTFTTVAQQLGDRSSQQVTERFMALMALYHQQGTSTDEETGTDGETEEDEGSEYSVEHSTEDPVDMEDD